MLIVTGLATASGPTADDIEQASASLLSAGLIEVSTASPTSWKLSPDAFCA